MKGCHQGQDVTVLAILERLEFKSFSCRPISIPWSLHFKIHCAGPEMIIIIENDVARLAKHTRKYVMRCAIWYHLHDLKNVKNTHGGVNAENTHGGFSLQLY